VCWVLVVPCRGEVDLNDMVGKGVPCGHFVQEIHSLQVAQQLGVVVLCELLLRSDSRQQDTRCIQANPNAGEPKAKQQYVHRAECTKLEVA
jgi:hypothetical protein